MSYTDYTASHLYQYEIAGGWDRMGEECVCVVGGGGGGGTCLFSILACHTPTAQQWFSISEQVSPEGGGGGGEWAHVCPEMLAFHTLTAHHPRCINMRFWVDRIGCDRRGGGEGDFP